MDILDLTKDYHNLLERSEGEEHTSFTWDFQVVSGRKKEESFFYFQDDLGSPIHLLSSNGQEDVYQYDEFGNQMMNQESRMPQPFTYTGYQKDLIAGTYYAQAREYQPQVGRFISEDVIKGNGVYPVTMNHYAYCWNRPMDLVDRDGRMPDISIADIENMKVLKDEVTEFMVQNVFGVTRTHYEDSDGELTNISITSHQGGNIVVANINTKKRFTGYSVNFSTPQMWKFKASASANVNFNDWKKCGISSSLSMNEGQVTTAFGMQISWDKSEFYGKISDSYHTGDLKIPGLDDLPNIPLGATISVKTTQHDFTNLVRGYCIVAPIVAAGCAALACASPALVGVAGTGGVKLLIDVLEIMLKQAPKYLGLKDTSDCNS
ncbi:RHS repeat-associated protein [Aequitasia blattaphilus]|uniref:RHS repeat domain-containing protein n=1 Tax=Aequitasia blattaphilus TaxID=2949332 RepID=UPI003D1C1AB9